MNIDRLLNMNGEVLKNYIIKCVSKEERIELLKDERIRKKFFEIENHYPFVWLVQELDDDLSSFLDSDCITLLINDDRVMDKLNAIISILSDEKNKILKDKRIISLLVNKGGLNSYISSLNIEFGTEYFKYIIENNQINNFIYLNDDVQLELLKDNNNLNKILEFNLGRNFFIGLKKNTLTFLLNNPIFINKVINLDIDAINSLAVKGIELPVKEEIITKYLEVFSISKYRSYIEALKINNSFLVDTIEKRRKKKYDNTYNTILDNGLIKEYNDMYESVLKYERPDTKDDVNLYFSILNAKNNNELLELLKEKSNDKLLEILIDRYFEDIPYNFFVNLEVILKFISKIDKELIDKDRLNIYMNIYNFHNLNIIEKKNLYNKMNNGINYVETFYDDYKRCEEYSYTLYNEEIISPSKMNKSTLSNDYGIDIYELNGEKFKAIVHQTGYSRDTKDTQIWFDNRPTVSMSMIDDTHFDLINDRDRDKYKHIVFGFNDLEKDRYLHTYHTDSYTSREYGTNRIKEISTPTELMDNTSGYNELLYIENNDTLKNTNAKKLKPSYIMSYDKITDSEVAIAKEYNIPIVLFHTDKYISKKTGIDFSDNNYLSYGEEKRISRR